MSARTIWKFDLRTWDEQFVEMPKGAIPLFVAEQFAQMRLWCEIPNPSAPMEVRRILIFGTGNPMPEDADQFDYIGTAVTAGGQLVWHVYVDELWASVSPDAEQQGEA